MLFLRYIFCVHLYSYSKNQTDVFTLYKYFCFFIEFKIRLNFCSIIIFFCKLNVFEREMYFKLKYIQKKNGKMYG